jgi:hypothetical protein
MKLIISKYHRATNCWYLQLITGALNLNIYFEINWYLNESLLVSQFSVMRFKQYFKSVSFRLEIHCERLYFSLLQYKGLFSVLNLRILYLHVLINTYRLPSSWYVRIVRTTSIKCIVTIMYCKMWFQVVFRYV